MVPLHRFLSPVGTFRLPKIHIFNHAPVHQGSIGTAPCQFVLPKGLLYADMPVMS